MKNQRGAVIVYVVAALAVATFVLLSYEACYFAQDEFLRKAGW